MIPSLDAAYWEHRYKEGTDSWDTGAVTTPLKTYFDQLTKKDLRILIPGAGPGHEAEYLHRAGFTNVFVIDLTDAPFKDLLERCPDFPKEHLIVGDFFTHEGSYDRIIEQTFFCAIDPSLREKYVATMFRLLAPTGKLVGVLFNDKLNDDKPPFGGSKETYLPVFAPHFPEVSFELCYNSIEPRANREIWLVARKDAAAYEPVDCSLHDQYLAWATLRKPLLIEHRDDHGVTIHSEGVITDVTTRADRSEWMTLDNGTSIRLDRIIKSSPR